jgi:queuine tRNA-ribosyltransferase
VNAFGFEEKYKDKKTDARIGVIHTPHGDIETPCFVPVGTQATVKSLTPQELHELDVRLFFVNTYHMYLRPGLDVIRKAGGLHRFMGWDGPVITDSGGFQVFSLGRKKYSATKHTGIPDSPSGFRNDSREDASPTLVRITEEGVIFRSHWDGSQHVFTPESSMQYQWALGSDIHIAFDDCTGYPVTEKQAKKSMERTHRWAQRSLEEHKRLASLSSRGNPPTGGDRSDLYNHNKDCFSLDFARDRNDRKRSYQALYGSIQGSVYENLRKESAKFITSLPFDGYAVGGVAVGESKKEMKNVLDWVSPFLPSDKPRHLLGVGEIDDIFTLVEHGFDTFDCVQPTRLARMGKVYCHRDPVKDGRSDLYNKDCFVALAPRNDKNFETDILKAEYSNDLNPIDRNCPCYTCRHFSRAYIHHLFKVRELLGYRLATIHNIAFINRLMERIRLAIKEGSLVALKKTWTI